jgi:hypothetical protein
MQRPVVRFGVGKWTVQQAAELSVAAPTITASLDGRYMSALKAERVAAAKQYKSLGLEVRCPFCCALLLVRVVHLRAVRFVRTGRESCE